MAIVKEMLLRSAGLLNRTVGLSNVSALSKYMAVQQALESNDIRIILDVGANAGQFAMAMRAIGFTGRIVSFEPTRAPFEALQAASRNDDRWTAMNFALGAAAATQTINIMRTDVFSSFSQPDQSHRDAGGNVVVRVEEVEVRSLDTVINELGIADQLANCFLKIDTQGHEMQVLEGCGDQLGRMRLIEVEISSVPLYKGTTGFADMIRYLDRDFIPIGLFPGMRMTVGAAHEFDYIGVSRRVSLGSQPSAES